MSDKKKRAFKASDLIRLKSSEDFQDSREPPFRIGDLVTINSGGPAMLVVDIDAGKITTAWKSDRDVNEGEWSRPCLHRVRDAW